MTEKPTPLSEDAAEWERQRDIYRTASEGVDLSDFGDLGEQANQVDLLVEEALERPGPIEFLLCHERFGSENDRGRLPALPSLYAAAADHRQITSGPSLDFSRLEGHVHGLLFELARHDEVATGDFDEATLAALRMDRALALAIGAGAALDSLCRAAGIPHPRRPVAVLVSQYLTTTDRRHMCLVEALALSGDPECVARLQQALADYRPSRR